MLGNGRVSIWDQACPAHRYAKPFQRKETVHRTVLGKVPVLAPRSPARRGCGSSMAKRQAGMGFGLKQSSGEAWLKSAEIMEILRRDTSLCMQQKANSTAKKCAGTKPQPGNARSIGKDFHSYNHKYYFFLSFKPQHALSESQTTPAICCPPHKAGGMSPSGRENNIPPSPAPAGMASTALSAHQE